MSRVPAAFVHATADIRQERAETVLFLLIQMGLTWFVLVHAPQRTDRCWLCWVLCSGLVVRDDFYVLIFFCFLLVLAVSSVWRSGKENPEE